MHHCSAIEEMLSGDKAVDARAIVDEMFKLGRTRATLTAALGMMFLCADEIRKENTGEEGTGDVQNLLHCIEGKVTEIRGLLLDSPQLQKTAGRSLSPAKSLDTLL